jgi:hypothetical protein
MPDVNKYYEMREAGAEAVDVFRSASSDGLKWTEIMEILKEVFGLSTIEAKEAGIIALGIAGSVHEYQGNLADAIEEALSGGDETDMR